MGYCVVNRNTGQGELEVEQEPAAILGMLWLQENYENVMADPVAAYRNRKAQYGSLVEGIELALREDEDDGFSVN